MHDAYCPDQPFVFPHCPPITFSSTHTQNRHTEGSPTPTLPSIILASHRLERSPVNAIARRQRAYAFASYLKDKSVNGAI